jgi:hypothetical protein
MLPLCPHCGCRVDHPSDLIWVTRPDDPLLQGTGWAPPAAILDGSQQQAAASTPIACKQRGDRFALHGSHIDALHAYRQGLAALEAAGGQAEGQSQQLRVDLLTGCAACCLSLGTPETAATGVAYVRAAQQAAGPGGNAEAQLMEAKGLMAAHRWVLCA